MNIFVHPTAVVDDGAHIGSGTKVWHFTHVSAGAEIGERCVLGQNVFIGARAVIGNRVKIQNNVSVYDDIVLEDDVFCGPSAVFTNVRNPRAHVERKDEYAKTKVHKGASIGANATIVCGVTLHRYSFIGAGAVVTRDVPSFAVVAGVPAKQIGWVSALGELLELPLTGNAEAVCPRDGSRYVLDGSRLKSALPDDETE